MTHKMAGILSVLGAALASGAEFKTVQFKTVTLDMNPPAKPYYKMVGDISSDGFPDVVVGGAKGPLVAYLAPDWRKIQLADGGWQGVNGEIADLDGDGDSDIVMGGVVWFENPANVNRPWNRKIIDDQKTHDIEVADLDRDGRPDVVARDQSAFGGNGNKIFVYYQQADFKWKRQVISCPHGEGLKLGDLDHDGDPDIIIGGLWYENSRNAQVPWVRRVYTTQWQEPDTKVEMADFNGDQRPDLVLAPAELRGEEYKISWFEAPPDPRTDNWKEHPVVEQIECVIHALGVGDFDGDDAVDIAIAEMHQGTDPDEVSILLNQNHGLSWKKQVLSDWGSHDIVVADIEDDGDLDIVGANHSGVHPLELWRNERH